MKSAVAVKIRQTEADVVPVRFDARARRSRVGIHADVVERVWSAKPTSSKKQTLCLLLEMAMKIEPRSVKILSLLIFNVQ